MRRMASCDWDRCHQQRAPAAALDQPLLPFQRPSVVLDRLRLPDETAAVMRWFWIDRFLEFESGSRAVATKNVTRAEYHLDDYTPGLPTYPTSLIVEGLAQTSGLLVGEHNQFLERVVLAKIGKATFHFPVTMGDQLRYETTIQNLQSDGAIVQSTSHVDDRLQAEVQLVFAHLDDRFPSELFDNADFLYMLRCFRLYDVGVDADGQPLKAPPHLLQAESEYCNS